MKGELSRIYLKYKKQLIPIVLIILAFFIVFRVIIPQLSTISESNQIIADNRQEVEKLQNTLNAVSSLNLTQAESDLSLVTRALPTAKDIALVFSALTGAATASQTELRDFSLEVGNVYGRASEVSSSRGVPAVEVSVRVISSDARNYTRFTEELENRLPLSKVKTIEASGNTGTFEISFYYKPFNLTSSSDAEVKSLNQADLNLLNQLREWDR